ncbi:MAG: Gfo/Idh/MocA family oxidoreductase [Acidobacteria bacterium]|jgi:predicted dehydrogenase|nr:Gfo/Idh/MocA family oxidoreductase [Bryobacteraceae bacterium CoA2 C42]
MSYSRRLFLNAAAASAVSGKQLAANRQLGYGVIGLGGNGFAHMKFAFDRGLRVTALCDVYGPHLDKALAAAKAAGHDPKVYRDFRGLLASPAVDIVGIHTPDHWHAFMAVEACKARKDIYLEKPIARTVDEAWTILAAARKYERVVQVGLQQRSGDIFKKAAEIVQSGQLGKISFVRAWNYSNVERSDLGHPPDTPPPADLDYDLWVGPARWRPFNSVRLQSNFRWFWDFGGGMMSDWGVHWLDIVHMAMGESMPRSVSAEGGRYVIRDMTETPDTMTAVYDYNAFLAQYEFRLRNAQSMIHDDPGMMFHGQTGTLHVTRKRLRLIPEKDSGLPAFEMEGRNHHNLTHWDNFIQCVHDRKRPVSDVESGCLATSAAHLGNVSLRSGLKVHWDDRQLTVHEPAARMLLSAEYRPPWKLSV